MELGSTTDIEKAKTDYVTGIKRLNDICMQYGKGEKAIGVRSINVEDINRVTGYNPNTAGYGKGLWPEYGITSTYSWDGSSEPYCKTETGIGRNMGMASEGIIHNGQFLYYNGKEFIISKLSDESNAGASTTNLKEITSFESTYYIYNPRTLISSDETKYPTKGIEQDTDAYKMLFRNIEDTENSKYWLATQAVMGGHYCVGYGFRVIIDGIVRAYSTVYSDVVPGNYNLGVRAVVSLAQDVVVTEGTTTDWTY